MRKAFQTLSSSDSMDFRALLLNESNNSSQAINGANSHLSPEIDPANPSQGPRKESDSESGFEDGSSSQMSRSLMDEGAGNNLSESDSFECLQIEQILSELQSVSVEWKSYRTVKNCSCAMPFEHHVKKVREGTRKQIGI